MIYSNNSIPEVLGAVGHTRTVFLSESSIQSSMPSQALCTLCYSFNVVQTKYVENVRAVKKLLKMQLFINWPLLKSKIKILINSYSI